MDQNNSLQPGLILDQRFKLLKKIGSGSFGIVYLTFDLDEKEYCATKFENRNLQMRMMNREILILKQMKGINGFPDLIHNGKDRQYSYYMSTLLGENLEILLQRCGGKFSLQTTLQLAIQLIDRLEVFHSMNFIHRDIKPENFLISKEDTSLVYLIDFGLSKYYRMADGKHIEFSQKTGVIGTARYASINTLQWMEQSRRDDLESLGYMLIYFVKGELPWSNVKAFCKDDKYDQILQVKMGIPLSQLCFNLPKCFINYFQHVKSLLFQQQPNYSHLRNLFEKQLQDYDHQLYDWELKLMEKHTQDVLIDPDTIPDIRLQSEIDLVPPVDEEGEAFHLKQENQHNVKFMKQLHEKYFDQNTYKQQDEFFLQKHTSIEPKSQATSKQNNYQISNHTLIQVESQPYIHNNPMQFTKRKDSKSYTSFKQSQEHKENRKFRLSNDDYDLDMANDDGPNLDLKNLEVNYFLK
ncbi:unnamed protein product (macronuclear) [Paramecium tetraurelia]|uniref:Casein kinase I n=1 Tax=Paramecium tetraurelia TaxID=5888 RepID=A0DDC0_PARTE|nr:uncharacterized protein GSPATT00015896001 [Paramecium tetraurelia]CAK81037.1 unnamed protein product [Paramecium tetraurelia]|eukprot:XP_001448434.1 hypothetical protein (macronuclear) [Paramecium tetraurelia strain d4-2]